MQHHSGYTPTSIKNVFYSENIPGSPVSSKPSDDTFTTLTKKKLFEWHMTCDMWQLTHDTCQVGGDEPSLKSSAF